jgi:hypothetical protein
MVHAFFEVLFQPSSPFNTGPIVTTELVHNVPPTVPVVSIREYMSNCTSHSSILVGDNAHRGFAFHCL